MVIVTDMESGERIFVFKAGEGVQLPPGDGWECPAFQPDMPTSDALIEDASRQAMPALLEYISTGPR